MSDLREMERPFILDFLEIYKRNQCLWKIRSREYTDRDLRAAGYDQLLEKFREVVPDAEKEHVIRKIDSLRGSFRKEYKKVRNSIKCGATGDEIYRPRLWYYDKMLFLKEDDASKRRINPSECEVSNMPRRLRLDGRRRRQINRIKVRAARLRNVNNTQLQQEALQESIQEFKNTLQCPMALQMNESFQPHFFGSMNNICELCNALHFKAEKTPPSTPTPVTDSPTPSIGVASVSRPPTSTKKMKTTHRLPNSYSSLKSEREVHVCSSCPCLAAQESEYDKIGKAWASELQKMDTDQQIYAKRSIAEIIFQGQLGVLGQKLIVTDCVDQQPIEQQEYIIEKTEPVFDC